MDPESLYKQVGRLVEEMPAFDAIGELTSEIHKWLGRADALIKQSDDPQDKMDWRVAVQMLTRSRPTGSEMMRLILYRVLAAAELSAPASAKGTFIPVGSSFDAFASISKIMQSAKHDVFVVDPYMDEAPLTEFAGVLAAGVALRLLSDEAKHKATLKVAATKWVSQHGNNRPLEVRLAPPKKLHDRAIFIDGTTAWALTQSIKDFAKRSPAEIVRVDDTAPLKIAAYEDLWRNATIVV